MVEMELIDLLRQLEMIVEEAPAKAFSHKVVVDREEILSLIKEMKSVIPEEVKQASWINTERVKIISDAKREAEEIVLQGEKEAERLLKENQRNLEDLDKEYQQKIEYMIENNQVVQRANERADEIKEKAEKYHSLETLFFLFFYSDTVIHDPVFCFHALKHLAEQPTVKGAAGGKGRRCLFQYGKYFFRYEGRLCFYRKACLRKSHPRFTGSYHRLFFPYDQ